MVAIAFPADVYAAVQEHLGRYAESVAFMRSALPDAHGVFRVEEARLIANQVGSSTIADRCEISDADRADLIRWAWASGDTLIEAHSHGTLLQPARFSRFDIAQLREWVPHVRWRLRNRPYVALVTASREIDGLAWTDAGLEAVDTIVVDGQPPIQTTGLSYREMTHGRAS